MPEFQLNKPRKAHPFHKLNSFAQGYVEAMFFTNCDTCDEKRENHANELGVERLTRESCAVIAKDCADFEKEAAELLTLAYSRFYAGDQAGRDFWFTRQGHGAGFWDRRELEGGELGDKLSAIAKRFGECYPEIWRGWIHYR